MQRIGAFALLLLMAVVVVASAWLRLNAPRAPCGSWPLCRLEQRVEPPVTAAPGVTGAVRALHRVAASAALLLILALAWRAWRRREHDALRRLVTLLALALALSALGIATPGSRAAAVMLGNLLGGALMFGLAWALWRTLPASAPALPSRLQRAATGVALLWIGQAALGALSGAAAGAAASLAHLLLALLLAVAAFGLALALRRAGHRGASNALGAVLALQLALGAAAAFGAAGSAFVLAHNAGAALGLALLLGWSVGPRIGQARHLTHRKT